MERHAGLVLAVGLVAVLVQPTHTQVNIQAKKSEYITQAHNDTELTKEIYTSMYELTQFFEKEKAYVDDIKAIIDKKLVSVEAQGALGAYVTSYDDVLGGQDEDDTFLHNPLNVYNLIRHVAVGWGIIEESLEKEKERRHGSLPKRVKRVLARYVLGVH